MHATFFGTCIRSTKPQNTSFVGVAGVDLASPRGRVHLVGFLDTSLNDRYHNVHLMKHYGSKWVLFENYNSNGIWPNYRAKLEFNQNIL